MSTEDERRATYQRLVTSSDPLLHEMGSQLITGSCRPSDLLTVPAYREVVLRGLRQLSASLEREHVRLGLQSPRSDHATTADMTNDRPPTTQPRASR